MQKFKGKIKSWNRKKGYGFITPDQGGEELFLHISQIPGRTPPKIGQSVRYQIGEFKGRKQAIGARLAGFNFSRIQITAWIFIILSLGICFLYFTNRVPIPWPIVLYALASTTAYIFYMADKRAAKGGHRRISEATLHGLELLGGWPGSFIAQKQFRHKTQKTSFRIVFWSIVLLHLAFWYWWFFALNCGLHCDASTLLDKLLILLK